MGGLFHLPKKRKPLSKNAKKMSLMKLGTKGNGFFSKLVAIKFGGTLVTKKLRKSQFSPYVTLPSP